MVAAARQRGYTLLLTLLVLLVGGASVYVAAREPGAAAKATEAAETASRLEAVRDAVIAYALSRDPDPPPPDNGDIPGALPCIDGNMPPDGVTDQTTCLNANNDDVLTGWLPWRTIDASRESGAFWYVMDSDFRQDDNSPTVGPINVSIPGSLQLNGQSGFAALIIEPGDPLATQTDRGTAGATIGDYLEGENADGDPSFEDCADIANCNDRIVGISVDRLLHAVQRRALAEIREELRDFHDDKGYFPYAAAFDGGLSCDSGTVRGRVPTHDGDCGSGESLSNADFIAAGAGWVTDNEWEEYVVYAVDPDCTNGGSCTTPGLELRDSTGLAVVLGAAGVQLDALGQDRTDLSTRTIDDYLESVENTDGDDTFDDLPFVENQDNDALIGFTAP